MRKRLSDEIAIKLGLKLITSDKVGNPKYYLNKKKLEEYNKIANLEKLSIKGKSTLSDKNGNLVMEWVKTEVSEKDKIENLRLAIKALNDDIIPCQATPKPETETYENLINQYTLTDYHLGMMAWAEETGADWDIKIAEKTLINYFKYAIESSPKAESCIFAQLGDFLHWDGMDAVTPQNRHLLDADTRFTKLVRVAIRVIRQVISMLLEKYPTVQVIMAEGNHDMASSIWLRETLSIFYENEPRITIDTNPSPYYCITWGDCCLFYHHGHKKNAESLDSVLVGKFKSEFGKSKFVYAHTGHLHNTKMIETNLMIVEQHRTLATKDAYASRGGWSSGRDSKVITYHKQFGEVDRRTINIDAIS
jgi:sulfur carrier protein ThiS